MIIRVDNPAAFENPLVRDFFFEAVKSHNFASPGAVVGDLINMLAQPGFACFVEVDEDGPQATIGILLPQSAFMECPQILFIYGKRPDATKSVVKAALQFGVDAGYNRGWGLNRTGKPDEAFGRLFSDVAKAHPVGTLLEYRVE